MKNLVPSGKASIIILALAATAACTPKRHGTTAAGKPFDCTIAVPETVDLGLSVCWGTHLVGQSHWADTPSSPSNGRPQSRADGGTTPSTAAPAAPTAC